MSWLSLYWGWTGRLNRLQFILGFYSLGIVATFLMMALVPVVARPSSGGGYIATDAVWVVIAATQLPILPLVASMAVRRLHDLNSSGYWLLLYPGVMAVDFVARCLSPSFADSPLEIAIIAPVAGAMLLAFFAPGLPPPNRFGSAPRPGWLP